MIVQIDNYSSFDRYNANYQRYSQTLVETIFETETLGKIGYQLSSIEDFNGGEEKYPMNEKKNNNLISVNFEKDASYFKNHTNKLGPLEASFIKYILGIRYPVIVLTGALGSGKSSLVNYCLDLIEEHQGISNYFDKDVKTFPEDGQIIRIDFNEAFIGNNKEDLLDEFHKVLIVRISGALTRIVRSNNFIDPFLNYLDQKYGSSDWEAYFNSFIRTWNNDLKKKAHTEDDKLNALLDWIDQSPTHSTPYKLRLLSYVLKYIKDNHFNPDTTDIIFLFDNIDRFRDDVQINIIGTIFSLYYKSTMKVVLPVRLTTFGKLDNNGSYNFGTFSNNGHYPVNLVKKRLKHFIDNTELYATDQISQYTMHHFVKIQDILAETGSRLNLALDSFAGNSIRRGLYLSERLLLNSVIPFDRSDVNVDRYVQALIVGNEVSGKMDNRDELLSNILIAPASGQNSLITVRILQILSVFASQDEKTCLMKVMLTQLQEIGNYGYDEILDSLNYMLRYRKRLIYIEGVQEYSDVDNLLQSVNDSVHITYSGVKYLDHLLYDIEYVQNCFIKTDWIISKDKFETNYILPFFERVLDSLSDGLTKGQVSQDALDYIQSIIQLKVMRIENFITSRIDFSSQHERMRFIREGLFLFILNDIREISYYYNYNLENMQSIENIYVRDLLFVDIFGKIAQTVAQRILRVEYYDEKEELLNWYGQLILVKELYQTIIGKENSNTALATNILEEKLARFL